MDNSEKILSLDLGSNSVGAIIRNKLTKNQFEKAIVTIFETGVAKDKENKYTISLAANRTENRSLRRLYQSRKYKLWAVLEALVNDKTNLYCPISGESLFKWRHYDKTEAKKFNGKGGRQYPVEDVGFGNWIKLDFNGDGKPDYISPYQLRNQLATEKLNFSIDENRFKLGRALYHIAQHRGFKSSKIVKNKDEDPIEKENNIENTNEDNVGKEKSKEINLFTEIEKLNIAVNRETDTIGMVFYRIETDGIFNENRNTEGIRIRKNLHQHVTRKMLIKEVKHIFDFQGIDFNSIFGKEGETVTIAKSAMFWQRPLKSQKGNVGYCTLENNKIFDPKKGYEVIRGKKRCPISRPEFEEFRALCFINNIQYRIKGNEDFRWESLPQELRNELFKTKFLVQKDFEFYSIYKWIKNKHSNWELNFNSKTNVSACSVSARMQKLFDEKWNTKEKIQKDGKDVLINEQKIYNENQNKPLEQPYFENIWHFLFESDDQDSIEDYGKKKLGLNDEDIKRLVSLWYAMPVGYAQLSLKAINNILPFLREGFIYTDAVLLAKVPEILGKALWNEHKAQITSSLKKDVIEKNRDEKRILIIINSLIAQHKSQINSSKDTNYIVSSLDHLIDVNSKERDDNQILQAIEEGFGKDFWKNLSDGKRNEIINQISEGYQQFFKSQTREFNKLPRLGDSMKQFIKDNFENIFENEEKQKFLKRLDTIYHPSIIEFYPEAKEEFYKHGAIVKQMVMLGSPKTGAFKNPMALRTLHELKKMANYLIATGQIDEDTKVVVEIGRELNDINKSWAIEKYQEIRRQENDEFAAAILELLNDNQLSDIKADANSNDDIDKFRLWYEMIESQEGYENKDKKFISTEEDKKPIEKKKKSKQNNKEINDEVDLFEFTENHYDKIKKEVWIKLKKAKDNVVEKYRLWKEQEYKCIYTGQIIKITDLFKEGVIDIEHTIPRSMSFDNSLANKTVCFIDFNRNIKKNQIPQDLPEKYKYIFQAGIERWQQKVKDLETRVEFWKGKSKQASTKDYKNTCIRQKHLWQFELCYWTNKVERFTTTEVKPGFKNSQLKDMQLISKYALHYLKSYFNKVEVQKGEVTALFRQIFEIQETGTEKDRSKHSHHAKDAVVLSIIPTAAIRDKMIELWYKIIEHKDLLKSDTLKNKIEIQSLISQFENELQQLKLQCQLPKGINQTIKRLDEELLINNISRNRAVIPASKKIRFKGKDFIAKGDSIRGQLHKETFYGKNRMVERDENQKPKRENDDWKYETGDKEFKFVLRKDVTKDLNIEKIVDPSLKEIIKKQIGNRTLAATLTQDGGLYMLKKDGSKAHKIRHIRCFAEDVSDPINVKPQTVVGYKEHKNFYWAKNGENVICSLYQKIIKDKKGNEAFDRELEIISLKKIADLVRAGEIKSLDVIEIYRKDKKGNDIVDENGQKEKPYAILKPGMKVIFYDVNLEELKKSEDENFSAYNERISYRTYKVTEFSGERVSFQHHLEARLDSELKKAYPDYKQDDKGNYINAQGETIKRENKQERITIYGVSGTAGFTKKVNEALTDNMENNFEPWPRLFYRAKSLNMAIEGKHFEMMPDGSVKWTI